jgi:hypothetical protein
MMYNVEPDLPLEPKRSIAGMPLPSVVGPMELPCGEILKNSSLGLERDALKVNLGSSPIAVQRASECGYGFGKRQHPDFMSARRRQDRAEPHLRLRPLIGFAGKADRRTFMLGSQLRIMRLSHQGDAGSGGGEVS